MEPIGTGVQISQAAPEYGAKSFPPVFRKIVANDIEEWFDKNLSSRQKLSVLLRLLVHSTTTSLKSIDFPGNDDAERHGWDGEVTTNASSSPWVPNGPSGWEFGVSKDILKKADHDFDKSVQHNEPHSRKEMTFIFVTPRRWKQKNQWVKEKRSSNKWKDVRAYDASDLEQWIERSVLAQIWLCEQLGRPTEGVISAEQCWHNWSCVCDPELTGTFFQKNYSKNAEKIKNFLHDKHSLYFTIHADSALEGAAFISYALKQIQNEGVPDLTHYFDSAIFFESDLAVAKVLNGVKDTLTVISSVEVEKAFAPFEKGNKAIVISSYGIASNSCDIELQPLDDRYMTESLLGLGLDREKSEYLCRSCGGSLTVLRRRLATNKAIQTPIWAKDHQSCRKILPFVLAGTWDINNENDLQALQSLSNPAISASIEDCFSELLNLPDSPVWSLRGQQGVISKIDAFSAVLPSINKSDFKRFINVAKAVLRDELKVESSPKSDFSCFFTPQPTRQFSNYIRKGVVDSFVLFGLFSDKVLNESWGVDIKNQLIEFVEGLLTPFTKECLFNQQDVLSLYAEIAPDVLLAFFKRDLEKNDSQLVHLFQPEKLNLFCNAPSPRGNVLHALEVMAWDPNYYDEVIEILARLSVVNKDKLITYPMYSLQMLLSPCNPQTTAGLQQRISALKWLNDKYPSIAWDLCLSLLPKHNQWITHYSTRPRWNTRIFTDDSKTSVNVSDIYQFLRHVCEILLSKESYLFIELTQLISYLPAFETQDQEKIWGFIEVWKDAETTTDMEIADLRNHIRQKAHISQQIPGPKRCRPCITERGLKVFNALCPKSLIAKNKWLFETVWVEDSADELAEECNYKERDRRIHKLRVGALKEISSTMGYKACFELSSNAPVQWIIGELLGEFVLSIEQTVDLIINEIGNQTSEAFIKGLLTGLGDSLPTALEALNIRLDSQNKINVFLLAPFNAITWDWVKKQSQEEQDLYWKQIEPGYFTRFNAQELECVNRLIQANRHSVAFRTIDLVIKEVSPELLYDLLFRAANSDDAFHHDPLISKYEIEKAFQAIDPCRAISCEDKAKLEFSYIEYLCKSCPEDDSCCPNLQNYLSKFPEKYSKLILCTTSRADDNEDSPEIKKLKANESFVEKAKKVLDGVDFLPIANKKSNRNGESLFSWVSKVREICQDNGRLIWADHYIAQLLGQTANGDDGVWPPHEVRDLLEKIRSEDLCRMTSIAKFNSRGAFFRGYDGEPEWALVRKFEQNYEKLKDSHPFVSKGLILPLIASYSNMAEDFDVEGKQAIRRGD